MSVAPTSSTDDVGVDELVGGPAVDPVSGAQIGYALALPPALLDDADGVRQICADLELPEDIELLITRTAPGATPRWRDTQLDSRYLVFDHRTPIRPLEPTDHGDYRVEPVGPETVDFVRWLLVEALADAYEHRGDPVDADGMKTMVADEFDFTDPQLRCFVARDESGTPAGHVTVRLGTVDDLTDEQYVELVDMFILDEHRHTRATPRLLGAAREVAAAAGADLLGHVVWVDETGPDVYAQLQAAGWRPTYDLWRTRLAAPSGS